MKEEGKWDHVLWSFCFHSGVSFIYNLQLFLTSSAKILLYYSKYYYQFQIFWRTSNAFKNIPQPTRFPRSASRSPSSLFFSWEFLCPIARSSFSFSVLRDRTTNYLNRIIKTITKFRSLVHPPKALFSPIPPFFSTTPSAVLPPPLRSIL